MDSVPSLKAWADSLGGITYPLLSDFYPHGQVAQTYGVLRPEGRSERAIFVIDKLGIIRYVDVHDIDQQPDNEQLFRVLSQLEPVTTVTAHTAYKPPQEAQPDPEPDADVIMYCTAWCPGCKRARNYFTEHGISCVEIDISRDRAAAQRVRGWANGYESTPTFNIRGTIIVNFDKEKIDRALGITE